MAATIPALGAEPSQPPVSDGPADPVASHASFTATALLDVLERALHARSSEWLFFRELKVGTGFINGSAQRLDAFALNCFPHQGMRRVCYEVKLSRADFLGELKKPLKRRIGMRYSNEFYFVTPQGLLDITEIPVDCGLVEIGKTSFEQSQALMNKQAGFFWFDAQSEPYCIVTVPACWRETPGPTWQFAAAMLRNQRKQWEDRPPVPPKQLKLELSAQAINRPLPPVDTPDTNTASALQTRASLPRSRTQNTAAPCVDRHSASQSASPCRSREAGPPDA